MRDVVLVVAVAVTFAWLSTAQVAILAGLVRRRRYWRAAASLVVPPLAPYWAWVEGMRLRAYLWIAGAVLYAIALALAWSSG